MTDKTAARRATARTVVLAGVIGLAAACGSGASTPRPPVAGAGANDFRAQVRKSLADAISSSNPTVTYSMSDDRDTACTDNSGKITGLLTLGVFIDIDDVSGGQGPVIMSRLAEFWRRQGAIVAMTTPVETGQNSPFSAQLPDLTVNGGVDNKGEVHLRAATKCIKP